MTEDFSHNRISAALDPWWLLRKDHTSDTPHQDEYGEFLNPDTIFEEVMHELSGRKDAGKPYDFTSTQT